VPLEVDGIVEASQEVTEVDYSPVENWINGNMMIPHFEEIIYKRLAVGYTIANTGSLDIEIDEKLEKLFIDEFRARSIIRENPQREMIYEIIRAEREIDVDELLRFLNYWYQIPKLQAKGLVLSLKRDDRVLIDGNMLVATRKKTFTKDKKTGKLKMKR